MRWSRAVALLLAGFAAWAAVALAIGGRTSLERLREWLAGDAGAVAREIADSLGEEAVNRPVEVSGAEVRLRGGEVRLVVREERGEHDRLTSAHVHVVATVPGGAARGLDACIFGFGATRAEALDSAARTYMERAFPPIAALVREGTMPSAALFAGTEPWGVAGFRGWVGPLAWEGRDGQGIDETLLSAIEGAGPFRGLSPVPSDGRAHLLKLVLEATEDGWRRTLELDGMATNVAREPWIGPKPPGLVVVVRFAAFQARDRIGDEGGREEALRGLAAPAAWLPEDESCLATAVPAKLGSVAFNSEACRGGRMLDCLEECKRGAMASCYAAAQELQAEPRLQAQALRLFRRSCRLGHASGCTNAAATIRAVGPGNDSPAVLDCVARTFDLVCEREGDPWACTMLGAALIEGDHLPRDLARARGVLGRSCRHGPQDPACTAAQQLLRQLDAPSGASGRLGE